MLDSEEIKGNIMTLKSIIIFGIRRYQYLFGAKPLFEKIQECRV